MKDYNIAVIGLGYVGLPLALAFGRNFKTYGFDIDLSRIRELNNYNDTNNEATSIEFKNSKFLKFTNDLTLIKNSNIFILTVPTPINEFKSPDLGPLIRATQMVGKLLKKNDIVIYESTVYPGCTEEICVPILENISNLKYNKHFFCGYSPERINPGDKINRLEKIKKVTSGSTEKIAIEVDNLYKSIITAGTHLAPSIKVAEASKAIENAQRDLNISFVNELSIIFDLMKIDTNDVIEAAATKWNFLKFKPGLVGGHCISVDPYYLLHKSESLGYTPAVISSGRRVNESMSSFIVSKLLKKMLENNLNISKSKILIMGITFKENCSDIRNSKVVNIYNELIEYKFDVDVYDPIANKHEVKKEYGIKLKIKLVKYDAIILAVPHSGFLELNFNNLINSKSSVIFDLKSVLKKDKSIIRL